MSTHTRADAMPILENVLAAAKGYGITDISIIAQWSLIRLATGTEFYNAPAFQYFLAEPLIHPQRKGQAIIDAFLSNQ